MRPGSGPIEVLSVEDNPADVTLIREMLKDSALRMNVQFVSDGEEMLQYLRRTGERRLPDLILLDLNLPRKDGREALREMRQDPRLRGIPVVVLTSSDRDEDVQSCYRNAANAYVTKPSDLDGFSSAIRGIEAFWLTLAVLPSRTQWGRC